MRVVRENRIFTKVLVYALINTFTLAYMPIADLSVAHAKRRDSASVYMFGFAMDGDKTPLELKGMAEEHFKEEFKDEKRIKFITPKNARERLKGGKAGQPTKGLEGKKKYYSRAKRYLKIAKEGVEEKEFEDAMDAALKAVKYFKKSANHVKDFSLVKEAYEQAAGASEAADENGSEFMQTVLAFERDYRPSGALKSGLKKAYEKASRLPKKSRLEITVEPENAKILVNNREDTSPYKGRKLIAGDYFIRIEADGYKPYTNVVTLPGGGRESLEVVLAPEQEGGSGDDKMGAFKTVNLKARDQEFDREFFEKAQRVGQWIGAEFLVFGAFKTKGEKSTFHPLVFDVEEGRMGQVKPAELDHSMEDTEDAIHFAYRDTEKAILKNFPNTILAAGGVVGGGSSAAAEEPPPAVDEEEPAEEPEEEPVEEVPAAPVALNLDVDQSIFLSGDDAAKAQEDSEAEESIAPTVTTPVYKKWWFWTIIGVVVVGGGVTAGVMLQPEDSNRRSELHLPSR